MTMTDFSSFTPELSNRIDKTLGGVRVSSDTSKVGYSWEEPWGCDDSANLSPRCNGGEDEATTTKATFEEIMNGLDDLERNSMKRREEAMEWVERLESMGSENINAEDTFKTEVCAHDIGLIEYLQRSLKASHDLANDKNAACHFISCTNSGK